MPKFTKPGAKTVTAHELARLLLAGPDIPTLHYDPSLIDIEQEVADGIDRSVAPPVIQYSEGKEDGRGPHLLIAGDLDEVDEEDEALLMLKDTKWAFDWLEEQLTRTGLQLVREGTRTMIVMGKSIFVGEDLYHAVIDGDSEEKRGGIRL